MDFIVDVQGFKGPIHEFILKELSIVRLGDKNAEPATLFFGSPYAWDTLPDRYKMTNKWLERHYHGISWDYGSIPYSLIKIIIGALLQDARTVYVKGHEKTRWLKKFLDSSTEIIDMDTLDCPSLHKLPKCRPDCYYYNHRRHHDRSTMQNNCANENVKRLRSWLYVYRALRLSGIF